MHSQGEVEVLLHFPGPPNPCKSLCSGSELKGSEGIQGEDDRRLR